MNNQIIGKEMTYTPKQVAQMLGVKPSTVYAWLSRAEMRAYKIGGTRLITTQQIADFHSQRGAGDYIDYRYAPKNLR